jgi:glutathionyl-hydroquinone reductase
VGDTYNDSSHESPLSCFYVYVHWNKATEQWRLCNEKGETIQEVYDCPTMKQLFPRSNKEKTTKFTMMIRWEGEINDTQS